MQSRLSKFGLAMILIGVPVSLMGQTGQVSGTVRDDAGAVLAGARVGLYIRPTSPDTKPYDAHATAGADGSYAFRGVPVGTYVLCANPGSAGDFLPACLWAEPSPFTVGSGQTVTRALTLQRGHRLRVRINDPQGLVAARTSDPRAALLVGIGPTATGFLALRPEPVAGAVREFTLAVPFDKELNLLVRTSAFRLADGRGAAVDAQAGVQLPIQARRAAPPAPVEFRIAGLAPGVN